MRIKHFLAAAAFMLLTTCSQTPVFATGIGEISYRSWAVCDKQDVAVSIAEMALESTEAAFWAWERADKYDLCYVTNGPMMPRAIVWRKELVDKTVLRVVRIADPGNVERYWITLESVTGEPPL